jgi:DHA3 family macrolide efflux protein-like MFS transporter
LISYSKLLRSNRAFRNLWVGLTTSYIGDALYNIAIAWFVYDYTRSALQVGLILVCKFAPQILFGMFFGALVDRWNRKRLMQIADAVQVAGTGLLVISILMNTFALWQVYAVTICLSAAGALFAPARSSWVPDMVPRQQLLAANALLALSQQISRLLGAVAGGTIVAFVGIQVAILVNTFTFIVSILFIQWIRDVPMYSSREENDESKNLLEDIKDGLNWLARHRVLLLLVIIGTVSNIALGPTNVLPPMLIKSELQATAWELGLFEAAIALGLLAGSLLIGKISPKKAGLLFIVGLGLEGVAMAIISIATLPWIAYVGNLMLGVAVMIAALPMGTLFQTLTPSHMRGRVNSISSIAFNVSVPITYGLIGGLADSIGAQTCYMIGAGLLIICAIIGAMNEQLRKVEITSDERGELAG